MSIDTTPQSDSNLDVTVTEADDLIKLDINPASFTLSGSGAVNSVNGYTGTVVLDSDDIAQGTTNLYSLQSNSITDDMTFNSVTADFFGVQHFTAKARETITAGQPVYISGHSGNTPEVMVADYDDPTKMPAFGIASADIANNNNGSISTYGDLIDVDTTGTNESETWAVGDELFVNGSKLTNIRPSSETQEVQKIAKIIRVHANNGQMFLMGAGRSNDVPNLDTNHVFIGNSGGVEKRLLTYTDISNTPDLTNYITASSTDTLTNKSGNISQWTNDAGYITSESDSQTLSFTNPNLSITNGNTVDLSALNTTTLAWSAITSTPTTIAGYGITDAFDGDYNSLTNQPTIPTQTVINNNGDNRIITGSGTADNLNGEADFTWDGTNAVIDGTASNLTTPVLLLKTDNSNWNAGQLMCEDSNGKVFTQVGRHNTGASTYQWNISLDPDNTHGRTGVTTFAGDYFVDFQKDYSDQANIKINNRIFGAHGGYYISVRGDYNSGGGNQYQYKPMNVVAEKFNVNAGQNNDLVFEVNDTNIVIGDGATRYSLPLTDGTTDQVLTTDGSGAVSFQDATGLQASTTPILSADSTQYFGGSATITNNVYDKPEWLCVIKDSGGNEVIYNGDITVDGLNITWDWGSLTPGDYDLEVKVQDFGKGESAVATETITKASSNFRYWRLHDFQGQTDSMGRVMVAEFRFYLQAGQTGTKYPTNMTSDTLPTPFVASADHAFSGYEAYKAFDGNINTGWWNLGSSQPYNDNISIDLGTAYDVKSMFIRPWQSSYLWDEVKIQASSTGAFSGEEITVYQATQVPATGLNIG